MRIKKKLCSVLSAAMLTMTALTSNLGFAEAADKIKIMPLGDSITYGMADEGGYRKYLWQFLKQKGYDNIDFSSGSIIPDR